MSFGLETSPPIEFSLQNHSAFCNTPQRIAFGFPVYPNFFFKLFNLKLHSNVHTEEVHYLNQ